jgi:lipopolysaccharide transport system ATP-binding protein
MGKVHAILSVGMGMREEVSGRENLFLDGTLMGRSHAETEANLQKMIDFAELGDFIDQPMRTYSSGMKARLSFASLITVDPEILIIDEALTVGDAFFGAKATKAIEDVASKGGIVIVVSHALASIEQMCSRALWIDGGLIRMDGPAKDVTRAYRDELHLRDEAAIRKKFGASGAPWAKSAKTFSVDEVSLLAESDGSARQMFETTERARLRARLSGAGFHRPSSLRIWVERNDGLVLFEESVALAAQADALSGKGPRFEVQIPLGELAWRPFIYQLHVEVVTPKGTVAHNATTFKIWAVEDVKGGAPVLRLPIEISCTG